MSFAGTIASCLGAWGLEPRLLSAHMAGPLPPPCAQCMPPLLQGMLSKYDEEEEDAGFQIRAGAVVADGKARQAAEERRKLAESARKQPTCPLATPLPPAGQCSRSLQHQATLPACCVSLLSICCCCSPGTETLAAGGPATFQNAADFYSKEEAAAFAKPKKRLRKKLRKKAGVAYS